MKITKITFAIAAVAVALFVAGCCKAPAPAPAHHAVYHSKLGKMSTKHDVKK